MCKSECLVSDGGDDSSWICSSQCADAQENPCPTHPSLCPALLGHVPKFGAHSQQCPHLEGQGHPHFAAPPRRLGLPHQSSNVWELSWGCLLEGVNKNLQLTSISALHSFSIQHILCSPPELFIPSLSFPFQNQGLLSSLCVSLNFSWSTDTSAGRQLSCWWLLTYIIHYFSYIFSAGICI